MPADDAIAHALDYADRWLDYRRWRLRIPGVQAAVRIDGELVLDTAHGVADASTGEPLTAQHRFRIASHSKSLAAILAMRLVDEGLLRLDDQAQQHAPALRGTDAGALLVRELLSHGGGAVRDSDDPSFWHLESDFPDAERMLAIVASGVERIPASTAFKYSNIGYGLLSLVIEGVTGLGYGEALERQVLAPLGVDGVRADLVAGDPGRLVTGHAALHSAQDRVALGSPHAGSLAAATGAIAGAASLTDVLRVVTDADDRLLSAAARRRMRQRHWTTTARSGGSSGYGLGLMLRSIDDREWVGHGGAWTGQATRTLVDPERDVVISVLTNAIDAPAEDLAVGIARILGAAQRPAATLEPADLERARSFEGAVASIWSRIDVVELGGRLLAIAPTAADPMAMVDVLEPLDDARVRVTTATGMGAGHEIATAQRDASGGVARWRGALHAESVPAVPDRGQRAD